MPMPRTTTRTERFGPRARHRASETHAARTRSSRAVIARHSNGPRLARGATAERVLSTRSKASLFSLPRPLTPLLVAVCRCAFGTAKRRRTATHLCPNHTQRNFHAAFLVASAVLAAYRMRNAQGARLEGRVGEMVGLPLSRRKVWGGAKGKQKPNGTLSQELDRFGHEHPRHASPPRRSWGSGAGRTGSRAERREKTRLGRVEGLSFYLLLNAPLLSEKNRRQNWARLLQGTRGADGLGGFGGCLLNGGGAKKNGEKGLSRRGGGCFLSSSSTSTFLGERRGGEKAFAPPALSPLRRHSSSSPHWPRAANGRATTPPCTRMAQEWGGGGC